MPGDANSYSGYKTGTNSSKVISCRYVISGKSLQSCALAATSAHRCHHHTFRANRFLTYHTLIGFLQRDEQRISYFYCPNVCFIEELSLNPCLYLRLWSDCLGYHDLSRLPYLLYPCQRAGDKPILPTISLLRSTFYLPPTSWQ